MSLLLTYRAAGRLDSLFSRSLRLYQVECSGSYLISDGPYFFHRQALRITKCQSSCRGPET
jgi:hypothetical protein